MGTVDQLLVWRKAHELVLAVYELTAGFPPGERFALTSQIRRAAVSIPANIAEGVARRGPREFRRYLDVARGSHSELSYLLRLSSDLGYSPDEAFLRLSDLSQETGRLLWGLYRSIRNASSHAPL